MRIWSATRRAMTVRHVRIHGRRAKQMGRVGALRLLRRVALRLVRRRGMRGGRLLVRLMLMLLRGMRRREARIPSDTGLRKVQARMSIGPRGTQARHGGRGFVSGGGGGVGGGLIEQDSGDGRRLRRLVCRERSKVLGTKGEIPLGTLQVSTGPAGQPTRESWWPCPVPNGGAACRCVEQRGAASSTSTPSRVVFLRVQMLRLDRR